MPRESRAAYRDPPAIVPTELLNSTFTCKQCGISCPINWFEKQAFPKESIPSNDGTGHWVPVSFLSTCGHCDDANDIPVETTRAKAKILISADEAARELQDKFYFTIAGCSVSPDIRQRTERRIKKLEKEISAESNGAITRFHAKDVMDQNAWADASLTQRLKYIKKMCKIARSLKISKFIFAGCLRNADKKQKRYLRDQVLAAYFMRVLDLATANGYRPAFAFDQVQAGKKNGWIDECITGIRRTPLFVKLARGIHIGEPDHIEPLSTLESQISDCLAYMTAREFACKIEGKSGFVPTAFFGESFFAGFNGNGDLIYRDGKGFPLAKVFGLD